MKKQLLHLITVGLFLFMGQFFAFTGEDSPEYSYGKVTEINSTKIILTEIDYETDNEVDIIYIINSSTELDGIESVSDIAVGDYVDIAYILQGGKRFAKVLTIERA